MDVQGEISPSHVLPQCLHPHSLQSMAETEAPVNDRTGQTQLGFGTAEEVEENGICVVTSLESTSAPVRWLSLQELPVLFS